MNIYIPTPPYSDNTKDGKHKVLLTDFYFQIDGYGLVIKKGFTWDGASIPWVMRWKYGTPFDGVHLVGGLIHDAIYANAVYIPTQITPTCIPRHLADFTRFQADNIYFALIRKYGAVMLRAFKEWAAVRFCGRSHWTKR